MLYVPVRSTVYGAIFTQHWVNYADRFIKHLAQVYARSAFINNRLAAFTKQTTVLQLFYMYSN